MYAYIPQAVLMALAALAVNALPSESGDQHRGEAAMSVRGSGRRLGAFGDLAGYEPSTKVTDMAILDLDQRSLEAQLSIGTEKSFTKAKNIYLNGGHAGAYAILNLDRPLQDSVDEGAPVSGLVDFDGNDADGRVSGFYFAKETTVRVSYPVPRDPDRVEGRRGCRVGSLKDVGEEATEGCYGSTGTIFIKGHKYSYTYDVLADTHNHISLSSLGDNTMDGHPMKDREFVQYYDYYRESNFGHHWVMAALKGTNVDYPGRGDANFSEISLAGRAEAARIGSAYMNTYMYMLRMMRLSLAKCKQPCSVECEADEIECDLCDDGAERAWDEAVALYAGSLEGDRGESGNGQFLYGLADELCADFGTFGSDGDGLEGISKTNSVVMQHFATGQMLIQTRSCERAEAHFQRIWKLMAVPLIQGVLRSAHDMDKKTWREGLDKAETERQNAQGAAFAATVLPRIHACNRDDAELLYGNMRVGAVYTDFKTMKLVLEANYECLGITCADVGGLLDVDTGEYFEGASPCSGVSATASRSYGEDHTSKRSSPAVVLFWSFFAVTASLICACCLFERLAGREKIDDASPLYDSDVEAELPEESAGEFL